MLRTTYSMEERTRTRRNVRRRKNVHKRHLSNQRQTEKMEKITESEVERLERQVHHYQQLVRQGIEELELFEKYNEERRQEMKKEKTMMESKKAILEEEKKEIDYLIRFEVSQVYEQMITLAAWEARLGHREVEGRENTYPYFNIEE